MEKMQIRIQIRAQENTSSRGALTAVVPPPPGEGSVRSGGKASSQAEEHKNVDRGAPDPDLDLDPVRLVRPALLPLESPSGLSWRPLPFHTSPTSHPYVPLAHPEPLMRWGHASVVHRGRLVVVGGYGGEGPHTRR